MALRIPTEWTVLIVSDNPEWNSVYRLSPRISLDHVRQIWRDEHCLFGHWKFVSVDGKTEYHEFETIRRIGETFPKSGIVNVRIVLSDEPTPSPLKKCYLVRKGERHRLNVKPGRKLKYVLPEKHRRGYLVNGKPIDLTKTARSCLKNKDVIYERGHGTWIRFSDGTVKTIELKADAIVNDLMFIIRKKEKGNFHLRHQGRKLGLREPVRYLRNSVEVCRAKFNVDVGDQQVCWETAYGDINFPEFVAQLAKAGDRSAEEMENLTFKCVGCERQVSMKIKGQVLETNCCIHKSLSLTAIHPVVTNEIGTSTGRSVNVRSSVGEARMGRGMGTVTGATDLPKYMHAGNQTDSPETNEIAVQYPPPIKLPLALINLTDTGPLRGRWRNVDVEVPKDCSVGDVREAVSALLERNPQRTKMVRCVGESHEGEKLFKVAGGAFATVGGERKQWKNLRYEELVYDNEKFIVPAGRRMVLYIHNR